MSDLSTEHAIKAIEALLEATLGPANVCAAKGAAFATGYILGDKDPDATQMMFERTTTACLNGEWRGE